MKRGGFTMMEMVVVVLILGVIAAAVTLRVQGPLTSAKTADVVGAVVDFDRTTRSAARSQNRPLCMVLTVSEGKLARTDETGTTPAGGTLQLPEGFRLTRARVRQEDCPAGQATIRYSRQGLTPSYAVRVEGPAGGQWLVVAGATGDVVQVNNEEDVRNILASAFSGNDAR